MDLWSHVRCSSELRLEHAFASLSLCRCCEAKVSNLQVEVAVKHKILWLKITMNETGIMEIVETLKQLFEIESRNLFLKSASECNQIEELTATNELKHDVLDVLACILLGVGLHSFSDFDHVDDVGMLEFLESVDLCFDEFIELLVLMKDLDGIASARIVFGELDFATDATAKRSSEDIVS